ncbi:MAG: NADH-quinone oxidoreductase subunit L [Planctomycetota bacterium]|nr:NADH-quinone oxidoreductase subunit L [Planctomycetota bacterium]
MMHALPSYAVWIVLAPALAALLQNFCGKLLPRKGDWLVVGGMGVSLALSLMVLMEWRALDPGHYFEGSVTWFQLTGGISFSVGIVIDGLTAAMLIVVTLVSLLVFVFSMGYMKGDRHYDRFFFWLSFFSTSMLILVVADNLLLLFVGWELVGLCSYKLIGFWGQDLANAEAAKKAFITTRVGDVGMLIGILMMYKACGTLSLQGVFAQVQAGAIQGSALTWAGIALFLGAVGKSAQFPLHVWLPDAMAGPTPVSALIHAATMVAAGVYFAARMFPIFTPQALYFIAWTGGVTALLAALIAVTQTDIKKVLAYSTISQLGYMILGVGVGAPWAAMFHLCTHAMFKACLFLGSGSVIHAMHHTQELEDMGGLRKKMPVTFWTFVVSTLALAGIPLFSGFMSKDAILFEALHSGQTALFAIGLGAAFLTAFYMTRMLWLCFMGEPRNREKHDHAHESPVSMTLPLVVLALLSIGIFWGGFADDYFTTPAYHADYPQTAEVAAAYAPAGEVRAHPHHPVWFLLLASAMGLGGIALGIALFRSGKRDQDTVLLPEGLHRTAKNKYYLDDLYLGWGFVGLGDTLSRWSRVADDRAVDGAVNGVGSAGVTVAEISGDADQVIVDGAVNLVADATDAVGGVASSAQTGRIRNYLGAARRS